MKENFKLSPSKAEERILFRNRRRKSVRRQQRKIGSLSGLLKNLKEKTLTD